VKHRRQQKLDGHSLVELKVLRGHDYAHAADAQDPLDAILARENVARTNAR
jgi:hypothetical protein